MGLKEKLVCLSVLSLLAQSCEKNITIYQSTTSKQARMSLVIPEKYQSSVAILIKKKGSKYLPDYSLLYGNDIFNNSNTQTLYNKQVMIDADKKLEFRVVYEISYNQVCDFRFNFIAESRKKYWFTLDHEAGPHRNFIDNLVLGPARGKCYPIMAKSVGGKFEFIKLEIEKISVWG